MIKPPCNKKNDGVIINDGHMDFKEKIEKHSVLGNTPASDRTTQQVETNSDFAFLCINISTRKIIPQINMTPSMPHVK